MKQSVALSIDPVAQIEVVEIKTSRVLRRRQVVIKVKDQSGEKIHTLGTRDTLSLSFSFTAGVN